MAEFWYKNGGITDIMLEEINVTQEQVDDLNNIAAFLAKKDVDRLEQRELYKKFKVRKADLIILLGNSIVYSTDIVAEAFRNEAVDKIMIAGGIGHSTIYLKRSIKNHIIYKEIDTDGRPESEILKDILVNYMGINESYILIERNSTNCGANALETKKIVDQWPRQPETIVLVQDPTMQLRTYASFLKAWQGNDSIRFINYPPLIPFFEFTNHQIRLFDYEIDGLWDLDRLISLIMGEIPRLLDNENGYGPNGKNFIAHVDIPDDVKESYERLLPYYGKFLNYRKM